MSIKAWEKEDSSVTARCCAWDIWGEIAAFLNKDLLIRSY